MPVHPMPAQAGPTPAEAAADDYLARTKGWRKADYRLEPRPPAGGREVIAVIHADDLTRPVPGRGKSVQLLIDRTTQQVVRELVYQ